jgi:subtilisin family serine protease
VSVDIDTYAYTHPDALFVWAADNTGDEGSQTIGDDAVSKNILTVGATLDGLPAHLLKTRGGLDLDGRAIPALFQPNSPFGCSAVLSAFNISGLLACPKQPLTDASCAATAQSVFDLGDGTPTVPGGYSSGGFLNSYGEAGNLEFVLCCGCSPQQVLRGLPSALRRVYAVAYSEIYYSRIVGKFSSRGPTVDGRIKPDVAAPGVQIISARARAMGFLDRPYANFSCSAAPFAVTFAGAGGSSPAPSPQFASFSAAEPLYISTVTVPFTSPTGKGYADLDVLDQDSFLPIVSLTRALLKGAKAGTLTFAINHTFPAGFNGAIYVDWNGAPGAAITLAAAGGSTVTQTPCFGSVASDRSITLNVRRGGGAAYAIEKTGTSMATPIVAGSAALVRQFFTGGFYSIPSSASTLAPAPATAGFSPSSALLKATLINSASPLLYNDICQLPGQDYNTCTERTYPRAQIQFLGGHGMPSLPRGLAFSSLGPATRATGALPSMVMPGLTQAPAPAQPSGTLIDPALSAWLRLARRFAATASPKKRPLRPPSHSLPFL